MASKTRGKRRRAKRGSGKRSSRKRTLKIVIAGGASNAKRRGRPVTRRVTF